MVKGSNFILKCLNCNKSGDLKSLLKILKAMVIKVKFYLLLLFLSTTLPVLSQDVKEVEGDAAFLFAYSVREGQMNNFVEGYKKHLQWHIDKKDPLPWSAWFVFTGNRLGLFIQPAPGEQWQQPHPKVH